MVVFRLSCRCCRPSVNTICSRVMIELSLLSSVSKHNMWSYYDWIYCCFRPSVNTMWSYYDWVYCCCHPSVNTICGRIMIGFIVVVFVSKHNVWSCYDWVVVVVVRQLKQYVVVL